MNILLPVQLYFFVLCKENDRFVYTILCQKKTLVKKDRNECRLLQGQVPPDFSYILGESLVRRGTPNDLYSFRLICGCGSLQKENPPSDKLLMTSVSLPKFFPLFLSLLTSRSKAFVYSRDSIKSPIYHRDLRSHSL